MNAHSPVLNYVGFTEIGISNQSERVYNSGSKETPHIHLGRKIFNCRTTFHIMQRIYGLSISLGPYSFKFSCENFTKANKAHHSDWPIGQPVCFALAGSLLLLFYLPFGQVFTKRFWSCSVGGAGVS